MATIKKHEGCIIVDSTQRGKSLPDSFSRTIPIYCATLNLAIKKFVLGCDADVMYEHPARASDWDTELHVPPKIVGPSEKKLIAERLDSFANKLLTSGADMRSICEAIKKPLRPIWITPQSKIHKGFEATNHNVTPQPHDEEVDDIPPTDAFLEAVNFSPIVCMSVSDPEKDGLPLAIKLSDLESPSTSFIYIQGAADDEETWARGLAYTQFWGHYDAFLSLIDSEAAIEKYIHTLVTKENEEPSESSMGSGKFDLIGMTNLAVGGWISGKLGCFLS
ncbi:tRNA A64-2'-O-ribosylphosphate transferase [Entomophthora muscae]|uniref:tRNA A64-2'-O-ribosylphosphate transferase n=1 Tax=Entomophthora muscae TaxID=34485 RepID=A0ACC2SIB1_9FUNG|nr:tRNA A64-2'-O-ribosylphosphate transferase [Entomophthora muscae]